MSEDTKLDELKKELIEEYELAKRLDSNISYKNFVEHIEKTPEFVELIGKNSELEAFLHTAQEGKNRVGIDALTKDQRNMFRNAIKHIKKRIINDEPVKKNNSNFNFNKIWGDPKWLIGIILTILAILAAFIIWYIGLPQPKLLITASPQYLYITNQSRGSIESHVIEFSVSSIGGREVQSLVGFGVNRHNMSTICRNQVGFFPLNFTQFCYIATVERNFELKCTPYLQPVKTQGEPIVINASLRDILDRYLNDTEGNFENCQSNESITICAHYEDKWQDKDCSLPIRVRIEYN